MYSTPYKLFLFLDSITSNKLIHILKYLWGVVSHPYAIAQNHKYRWYATFVIVQKLYIEWIYTYICYFGLWVVFNYVLEWYPTSLIFFFCFFHSITSNKPIHNFFSEGGWSSLCPCSKLQISLILYFHVRSEIIYEPDPWATPIPKHHPY